MGKTLSFEDAIDELMVLLQIQRPVRKWSSVPLSRFARLEPTFCERYRVLNQTNDPMYFVDDEVTPRVVPDADVALLRNCADDDSPNLRDDCFSMTRFRLLRQNECRGRVWKTMRYMAEYALGIASVGGRFESTGRLLGSMDGREWWSVGPNNAYAFYRFCKVSGYDQPPEPTANPDEVVLSKQIALSLSVALTNEYEWSVSIGNEGQASIRVPVSPPAVKDLFRLRDMPEGRSRRAALRHWVASHWRKKHDDPKTETEVRQHFRGVERFNWNGLICEVVPSKHAKGRIEAAQEQPPRRRERDELGNYRMVDMALARAGLARAFP